MPVNCSLHRRSSAPRWPLWIALLWGLSGCTATPAPLKPQPVPETYLHDLPALVIPRAGLPDAEQIDEIQRVHRINAGHLGICYGRYNDLRRALEERGLTP